MHPDSPIKVGTISHRVNIYDCLNLLFLENIQTILGNPASDVNLWFWHVDGLWQIIEE